MRSDRAKNDDGCISTLQLAAILDISPNTARGWVKSGLVDPTRYEGGIGNAARWDLRDATAMRAIAYLRRARVPMRDVRYVQRELRKMGEDFASARLAAVDRGHRIVDVVLIRGAAERKKLALSLVESPGQTIVAEIAMAELHRETRKAFAKEAAKPAKIRGRKKGQKAAQSGRKARKAA